MGRSLSFLRKVSFIFGFICLAPAARAAEDAPVGSPPPVAGGSELPSLWSTTEGISAPESAFFDPATRTIFVSNVAGGATDRDGKGWITQLDLHGKSLHAKWADGLNAPKGIRVAAGKLHVADIDELVTYDVKTRKETARLKIAGASFLNDVAVGPDGAVYVSDMVTSKIHRVKGGKAEVFVQSPGIEHPNGLLVRGSSLIVATWGTGMKSDFSTARHGGLYSIPLAGKSPQATPLTSRFGNLDGLEFDGASYLVSDWVAGAVYRLPPGKLVPKAILTGFKGAADIGWAPSARLLIIPRMGEDRVTAYELPR